MGCMNWIDLSSTVSLHPLAVLKSLSCMLRLLASTWYLLEKEQYHENTMKTVEFN